MRTATELLVQYAAYHRDRRNIVSHFIGVPMIVFAIGVLLARPALGRRPRADAGVDPLRLAAAWYPDARQRSPRRRRQRPPSPPFSGSASSGPTAPFRSGSAGASAPSPSAG